MSGTLIQISFLYPVMLRRRPIDAADRRAAGEWEEVILLNKTTVGKPFSAHLRDPRRRKLSGYLYESTPVTRIH